MESAPETTPREEQVLGGKGPLSGAKVVNLSPAVSEEMGLKGPARGVVITDVGRGSVASRVGFAPGDRVLAINDEEVADVKTLASLNGMEARFWKVTIQRNGQVLTQVFRF